MSSVIITIAIIFLFRIWPGWAGRMTEWAQGPYQAIRGLRQLAKPKLSPFGVASSCSIHETNWQEPLATSCFDKEASRKRGFNMADGAVFEL